MNKNGFIENWGAFALLSAVGVAVVAFMLIVWGRMDFVVPMWQKIIIIGGAIVGAGFFTKLWFE